MPGSRHPDRIDFSQPAHVQIRVQGAIPEAYADRLGGLVLSTAPLSAGPISQTPGEQIEPITVLAGELSDQAALIGVLTTLHELHLSLLSVERIGEVREGEAA